MIEEKLHMKKDGKPKILIVDDRPENLLALELIFEDEPYDIIKASSGNEALAHMLGHDFAVVLLDVQMPEMDGFETAELMRSNKKTKHIPIIFVTAISKEKQHIFKGYESGAVDYLFKPLVPEILKSKVGVFLRMYQQQKSLEVTNNKLGQAVENLEKANRKIQEQQKAVIEEERLKVLLEMAGATAHELNQPLMVLLSSIELIEIYREKPEEMIKNLARIKEAGLCISEVIQKIQTVRPFDGKTHSIHTQMLNFEQVINILYIEDSVDDFNQVKEILSSKKNISLLHAATIQDGLSIVSQPGSSRIDIIFLDFMLKDGTGFDLLKQLDQNDSEIAVVIITGQGDEIISAQLIQAGAYDYLPKFMISEGSLSKIIKQALEKSRLKLDLKRMQSQLIETSTKDSMTGLYNRRYFMESLANEVERAERYKRDLSLLMIDIDHFKSVNDTYGHQTGDEVISGLGKLLLSLSRETDIAGRFGGEEFAIILPESGEEGARRMGERIRKAVADAEFTSPEVPLRITVSVGFAANSHVKTVRALVQEADKALYRAKENGRNRVEGLE